MIEYLAITIILSSVFLYALLLMIECGATIFVAAPELLGAGDAGKGMMSAYVGPLWETTNVFLVFSFVSLMAFFPGALSAWGHALIVPFFAFLAVMGIRALGMLYAFYHDGNGRFVKILLVSAALASPTTFAAGIIPYFLSGNMPYGIAEWLLSFGIGAATLLATFFVSFSFFGYLASRRGINAAHSLDFLTALFGFFFILLSYFLFLMLPVVAPHIAAGMDSATTIFSGLAVAWFALSLRFYRKHKGWRFALSGGLFGVLFFGIAFAQLPYIIYPAITLAGAFADPAAARALFVVFGIGAAFTIPALGALYYLFIRRK